MGGVACWFIDTGYNGESFFVPQPTSRVVGDLFHRQPTVPEAEDQGQIAGTHRD